MLLHNSGVKLFRRCPAAYKHGELDLLPHRHPLTLCDAMNRGSAFHGVAASYGAYCQQSGREVDLEAVDQLAAATRHTVSDDQLSTYDFHISQFKESAWVQIGSDDEFELKLSHSLPGTDTDYYGTVDKLVLGLCTQVFDYKTQLFVPPQPRTPPRQLLGYAWLTWKDRPDVIEWPMQLTLAYVQNCTEQTWQVWESDLEVFEKELVATALEIKQSKYKPEPHPDVCSNCPFVLICDVMDKIVPKKAVKNIRTIADYYRRALTFIEGNKGVMREQCKNHTINGLGYYNVTKDFMNKEVIWYGWKGAAGVDKDELAVLLATGSRGKTFKFAKEHDLEFPEGSVVEKTSTHFGIINKK